MCLKLSLKLGSYKNLILKTLKIEVLLKPKSSNFTTSKLNLKHKDCLYAKNFRGPKFSPQSELSNNHSPDRRKKSDAAFKILNTSPFKNTKNEEKIKLKNYYLIHSIFNLTGELNKKNHEVVK